MLGAICKLISAVLFGLFLIWATFKIGTGLDYWGPFVMCIVGLVCGTICAVCKAIANKKK